MTVRSKAHADVPVVVGENVLENVGDGDARGAEGHGAGDCPVPQPISTNEVGAWLPHESRYNDMVFSVPAERDNPPVHTL